MYLIESKRNGEWIYDPGTAMALQEYVKDNIFLDDDVLFPYMMHPAVQIGKFQNAYEEVNQPYMDEHGIKIIRRETGGGAIYLDDRNMSFCFLFNGTNDIYGNYARLYEPAIKALKRLGVDENILEQKGRNDLILDGKKISGAAMTVQQGRVYAGYSLLLDPNYEAMATVLNPNQKKIESHGIQSVRSRVGAIRPYLAAEHKDMTVWEFTDYMICELLGINDVRKAKRYELTDEDWASVDKIAAEKYNNWDWNYGRFQKFEYRLTERFPIGTVSVGLTIEHAKIAAIQITGDFFGTKDVKDIEAALLNVRLRKADLLFALEPFDLSNYFGKLTIEDFVQFILSENPYIERRIHLVKLGILDYAQIDEGSDAKRALHHTIELAKLADSLGYERFWMAEHHDVPAFASSSPELIMMRLADATERIRLGSGGVMIPHYSPYKVAENFRILEAFHPGRIDLGIGNTVGTPIVNRVLNENKTSKLNYEQSIRDLASYLTDQIDENHRFHGITANPVIPTVPEMWALSMSLRTAKIAAKLGIGYTYGHFLGGMDRLGIGTKAVATYHDEFTPSPFMQTPKVSLATFVVVAETREEAEEYREALDLWLLGNDYFSQFKRFPSIETARNYTYTEKEKALVQVNRKKMVVGDISQVTKQLDELISQLKADEVLIVSLMPGIEARKKAIKLLAVAFN